MGERVLIACEYSATVRDAFRARGFEAWSNDILPTTGDPSWHIHGDVWDAISARDWDLIILHLPCTAMALCGNKHYGTYKPKNEDRLDAIEWSMDILRFALSKAPHVALENPGSVIFPIVRRELNADVQYIQPWQHGHSEQKKTGLALWSLPRLTETDNVYDLMMLLTKAQRERIFYMSPSEDRGLLRSKFYTGFANAMASQWGDFIREPTRDLFGEAA